MKKLNWRFISMVIVVLSMLLTACGGQVEAPPVDSAAAEKVAELESQISALSKQLEEAVDNTEVKNN